MALIYTLPDAREVRAGQPFELNGKAYPGNWLALASEGELTALGITSAEEQVPAPTEDQLKAYAMAKQKAMSDAGLVVDIGEAPTEILVNVDTTLEGRADILGLKGLLDLGAPTVTWYQAAGDVEIDAAQLAIIGTAAATLRAEAVAKGTEAWVGIEAETITSFAEIDALFAS